MLRFNLKSKIALLIFFAVPIVFINHSIWLEQIGNLNSGVQSDYFIDGYYYIYLGKQAIQLAQAADLNIYQASEVLKPNESSVGIVFLSALTYILPYSLYVIPLLLLTVYITFLYLFIKSGRFSDSVLFLPFSGLLPYLFIPTKETFFLLGFLMVVLAYVKRRFLSIGLMGLLLMYMARSEAFYLMLASTFLWYAREKSRAFFYVLIIIFCSVYFSFFRELLFQKATAFQIQAHLANTAFCNIGPLSFCIDEIGDVEWFYFNRVLAIILLPFQWLWYFIEIFLDSNIGITGTIIRVAILMQIVWAYLVFFIKSNLACTNEKIRGLVFMFFIIYCGSYGAIMFFQPTRQVLLASTILFIGCCLKPQLIKRII